MDLVHTSYQSFEDLREYCCKVASAVGLICIEISGYEDPVAKAYVADLGMAMQLTNILRRPQGGCPERPHIRSAGRDRLVWVLAG